MKKVLIIAAHPDDEILGCGGFISKYLPRGVKFKIIFIGEGSTCRFKDPSCIESISATKQRNESAEKSMAIIGIEDYVFYNLPCGRLDQVPIISINKIIEEEIREFSPDTVFTHSPHDVNNDHKIVFNSTLMATRPCAKDSISRLFSYEVLSSSEWSFVNTFSPNYFEEISGRELTLKWRALVAYESEVRSFPFPRSEEGIRALAMVRGMQSGFVYAEAFRLIRALNR